MKKETIKEIVSKYARGKYYFHINDLKKRFSERQINYKEDTLKKNIQRLKKEKIIYEAGRGWYSTIKEKFTLNTMPIEKIVALIKKKFLLLQFSCWSTEQLKGFFHHLPSKFVTFVYADKETLQFLKDFLMDNDYNVYLNPYKIEAEKYVELKNRTVILRPFVFPRKAKRDFMASIEKILVDLFIENKKIKLTDLEEYRRIVSNILLNYRINMPMLLDYADRREIWKEIKKIINEIAKIH
jgi:hypothetical protein